MAHTEPMGVHIAFSAEQLNTMGVPDDMTEDELGDLVDTAFLTDYEALSIEIQQWIENKEYGL
jgi:hypothetical protein